MGFIVSDGILVLELKLVMGFILDLEVFILELEVNFLNEGNGDNFFFFIEYEIIYRLKMIMIWNIYFVV